MIRFICVTIFCFCILPVSNSQEKKLVWADEFNYSGLPDSTKWSYDTGGHGWGNNELQFYTAARMENARVENGHLIIEAKMEIYDSSNYTSARLISKGKGDWKYGRIEVKAKLPHGTGIWPAIWMLPTKWVYGGWPKSGEIDIMEFVGYMPDSLFGTVHTAAYNHSIGTQKGGSILKKTLSNQFHIYSIEWSPEKINFLIDDELYFVFENDKSGSDAWPFDEEFHLLLNIAVGGNWGGKMGIDENIFPQKMFIDYVRVYQ
jgi:beta-glucanase (GH16 family)